MKKLMITTIAFAASIVAFGQQFKYSDVYVLAEPHLQWLKAKNIDTNKTYELEDIKVI